MTSRPFNISIKLCKRLKKTAQFSTQPGTWYPPRADKMFRGQKLEKGSKFKEEEIETVNEEKTKRPGA